MAPYAINGSLAQVGGAIHQLSVRVADIEASVHTEWKHARDDQYSPMLKKLDEIGGHSVYLADIHDELKGIENLVSAIAAHPAFTWDADKD